MKKTSLILTLCSALIGAAPREIPKEMLDAFTEGGKIPVRKFYCDGTKPDRMKYYNWDKSVIDDYIKKARKRQRMYYGATDTFLYSVLDKYISRIKGKEVAIVGSLKPWYESIILAYNGKPITIEYNTITCNDPRITTYTVEEFEKIDKKFDVVLSISSIEHSGLGRYGDELDPYGDYKAMDELAEMLTDDGILILAVPVGLDAIEFNAHRIYGEIRLRKLFAKWNVLEKVGLYRKQMQTNLKHNRQPVFVLQKKM